MTRWWPFRRRPDRVSEAWLLHARQQESRVESHGPVIDWPIQTRLNATAWVQTRLLKRTAPRS